MRLDGELLTSARLSCARRSRRSSARLAALGYWLGAMALSGRRTVGAWPHRDGELRLRAAGGAGALFTTRAHGNLSTLRGEQPEHGRRERDRLCEELGLRWLCASRQVHGRTVQRVRTQDGSGGEAVALDADGHATALQGVGVMVLVADCLPVLLVRAAQSRRSTPVGEGWRKESWRRACARCASSAARGEIVALVGPGAGPCCYEVGEEVHAAFGGAQRVGARNIDLPALARERLAAAGVGLVERVALHDLRRALLLPSARRRARRSPGGDRVAELIARPDAVRIRAEPRANPRGDRASRRRAGARLRRRRARCWRRPSTSRSTTCRCSPRAGVELVGENRAQDLAGEGRRARRAVRVGLHRAAAEPPRARDRSARAPDPLGGERVGAAGARAVTASTRGPGLEILLEVNVAREPGKAGVAPEQLESFLERAPLPVAGLMTMPPFAEDPDESRRWFAALRELGAAHGLPHLSMGTAPGLSGRGRRGRDDRADWREAVRLGLVVAAVASHRTVVTRSRRSREAISNGLA